MADPVSKLVDSATMDAATDALDAHMQGVELDVLELIARRLGKVTKNTSQSDVAQTVADDMPKIGRMLREGGMTSAEFIEALFDEMAELNDEWARDYYEAAGVPQSPVGEDAALSATLNAGKAQAEGATVAMVDTSVVGIVAADGTLKPVAEAYRDALNEAVRAMVGGEVSKAKAVQDIVARLAESGLRVQYPGGRTMELYAAVRQSVHQGYRDTMQGLRDKQGERFGADGVEVSAHSRCAPDHQKIQGRQFTTAEFERVNNSLRRKIGTHNCRHMTYPVLIGVSSKRYTKAERDEMIAASNRKVSYTDARGVKRECTAYEFTQVQRRMELGIRKLRAQSRLLASAGQPTAEIDALAEAMLADYRRVSRQAKVRTRMERTEL